MRTLVMGDIHGGLRALKQVLERCGYDKDNDKIIFLGDYVDGWSESAQVIQFLIELQKEAKHDHVFIRGNHDKWCQDWLWHGQSPSMWVMQGGQATINSYIDTEHLTEQSHRDFFKNLVNYYIDEENRGFVHGGFHSRKGLGHEVYQSDYYWDRDLWQLALMSDGRIHLDEGIPQGMRMYKHKEVYVGHTSTCYWNYKHNGVLRITDNTNPNCKVGKMITTPIQACNVWDLDTGGGFKGKLTIMDIDSKQYWQSDYVFGLYPEEKGRT